MKLISTLPFLVMLIGLILWFLTDKPKVSESGRTMFAFGLLLVLLGAAGKSLF